MKDSKKSTSSACKKRVAKLPPTLVLVLLIAISALVLVCFNNIPLGSSVMTNGSRVRAYSRLKQKPNDDRIFFHETSGSNFLHVKQLCAVESAAMHNPSRPVEVYFHTPRRPNLCSPWVKVIDAYPNIDLIMLNETDFFANSPFDTWHLFYRKSKESDNAARMSQFAKALNSHRGGGTYLDLDVLVLKQLDQRALADFFTFERESTGVLSSHAYHLSYGNAVLKEVVHFLSTHFDFYSDYPDIFSLAINEAMKKACSPPDKLVALSFNNTRCSDINLMSHAAFHPIPVESFVYLFGGLADEGPLNEMKKSSLGVHLWESQSFNYPVVFDYNLTVSFLAKEHCPVTVAQASSFI